MPSLRIRVLLAFACGLSSSLGFVASGESAGWTVGTAGTILKSTDAGATWTLKNPTTNDFHAVYFVNDNTGWAVGTTGSIFKTSDGGNNWTGTFPTGATLNSVFFVSSTTGWAVGTTGTILKTTNGGAAWSSLNPTVQTLNGLFFIDATTGWAVGSGGIILKTIDGGATWSSSFPTGAVLNSVFFVSSTTGWAVGTTGTILKTTNGGTTWTPSNPSTATLNSVYFVNAMTGFAVGTGGTILKTTNAGTSWSLQTPATAEFKSVRFVNATTGWAVGTGGAVFKTTDTGATWTGTFPTTATLYGVFFVSIPVNISVTVSTSPAGRSFTVDATTYTSSQTFTWVSGSSHTISTTSPQAGGAGTQYVWTSWSDAGAISHTVAPTSNTTYTANFKTQYFLTMNAGAGGTVSPASGYRDAATMVSISATPNPSFAFTGWTGTGTGSYSGPNNPASITMNGPITETGNFAPTVSATVSTSPAGRSFTVDATTYTSSQTFTWVSGSSHTISTTSPQAGGAGTQYVWTSWSDAGAISHTVAPTSNTTYTANFKTQYFLTMNAGAGGTVSPASGYRDAATMVSISATPNPSFAFTGWTGSGSGSYTGSDNPASVTMSAPITETAAFAQGIAVTVGTTPAGLSFNVDGVDYTSSQAFSWTSGSMHAIGTTSPQPGGADVRRVWISWSDGGAITHTVAPTAPASYVADFKTQYFLSMSADTGGTVTPTSGWQDSAGAIQIQAMPSPGSAFVFDSWTGSGPGSYSGPDNPAAITMNGPISEHARFLDLTGVDDSPHSIPKELWLDPRPNPVFDRAVFAFGLPKGGVTSLRILDMRGRLVASLVSGFLPAGQYSRRWEVRDQSGRGLRSGIYVVRLEAAGGARARRIAIVR